MRRVLLWGVCLGLYVVLVALIWNAMVKGSGVTVSSWWRSWSHNADVGGVAWSRHLIGWGWDVVPRNVGNVTRLENLGLTVLPIGTYADHLHAQVTLGTIPKFALRVLSPIKAESRVA